MCLRRFKTVDSILFIPNFTICNQGNIRPTFGLSYFAPIDIFWLVSIFFSSSMYSDRVYFCIVKGKNKILESIMTISAKPYFCANMMIRVIFFNFICYLINCFWLFKKNSSSFIFINSFCWAPKIQIDSSRAKLNSSGSIF